MDVEAIQLLNLSPIPELSELELSTVMDQLSGLSDVNGDLTDQHVEDIIKEAEDLIDKSECNKVNKLTAEKLSETEEKSLDINEVANELKGSGDCYFQELPLDDNKHYNTPVNSDHLINEHSVNNDNKNFNSPIEQVPFKTFSPGGSCNHIKSTIDSLKEFSSMIEMQLTNKSPNLSPRYKKIFRDNERDLKIKEVTISDSQMSEKSSQSRIVKTSHLMTAKNSVDPVDKSIKLLNCFERLYQNRPVRLSANKKPKANDKIPKTLTRKKLTKDLKSTLRNNKQGKGVKKIMGEDTINTMTENIYINMPYASPRTVKMDFLNLDRSPSEYSSFSSYKYSSDWKLAETKAANDLLVEKLRRDPFGDNKQSSGTNQNLSKIDEKLILKILEEVEQIKDQVKKAGFFSDYQISEKPSTEEQGVIDSLKSEMESVREKVTSVSNAGIKRLQEQFSLLKLKYYQQMDKLEAENCKLREALHNQKKFFASKKNLSIAPVSETCITAETRNFKTSLPDSPSSSDTGKMISQNGFTNCIVPSAEELSASTTSKEASCQTEKEISNVSVQCSPDVPEEGKKETATETRKAENKENMTVRSKLGRSKPFSDVGIHQLMRQKKLLDHESQLLATLRGLQSELTVKDKENRKLKTEMESLKKQIKRLANNKVDNCRKSHTGTQTIGLGPCVQKTYTPEAYEVPKEFERENEDLKLRIRALEEDFEMLKAKRINDLQSLHQVHEEEMAKLVSKLETQSSLTRHLHSLLVNR